MVLRSAFLRLFCLLFVLVLGAGCIPMGPSRQPLPKDQLLVLAVPMSGSYAAIANKIATGARSAKQELLSQGMDVKLIFVDTNAADWTKKLAALPERAMLVGGPLSPQAYNTAKKAGLLEQRVFFAFLNNLDGQDEGVLAWRFFPSPKDQILALLNYCGDTLHIRSFGAFYPMDPYSSKMVSLLETELARKNLPLQKASYNAANAQGWSEAARALVHPVTNLEGGTVPQTSFEALFLPGSWKHVDGIINSLMANGEDRCVLMGTMLWEQSLSGKRQPRVQRYELVLFPGAWNISAKLPLQTSLANDFWTSLGYDFVHFGAHMQLSPRISQPEVVAKANRAARVLKALAPISWNPQGIAHQRLFIYRLASQGMVPMDTQIFQQLRMERKEKAALRLQGGLPEVPEVPRESAPVLAPTPELAPALAEPQVVAPTSKPIGTVPQSSYKLRLPTKRP